MDSLFQCNHTNMQFYVLNCKVGSGRKEIPRRLWRMIKHWPLLVSDRDKRKVFELNETTSGLECSKQPEEV